MRGGNARGTRKTAETASVVTGGAMVAAVETSGRIWTAAEGMRAITNAAGLTTGGTEISAEREMTVARTLMTMGGM